MAMQIWSYTILHIAIRSFMFYFLIGSPFWTFLPWSSCCLNFANGGSAFTDHNTSFEHWKYSWILYCDVRISFISLKINLFWSISKKRVSITQDFWLWSSFIFVYHLNRDGTFARPQFFKHWKSIAIVLELQASHLGCFSKQPFTWSS